MLMLDVYVWIEFTYAHHIITLIYLTIMQFSYDFSMGVGPKQSIIGNICLAGKKRWTQKP